MRILVIHNEYGARSGEEIEFDHICGILRAKGHSVEAYTRSSRELAASKLRQLSAFFSGIYNPFACRTIARIARELRPQLALVQNLFPLISPAVLPTLRNLGIPIVMQVANYRLLCPNGNFVSQGSICEKCAPGREYWCVLKNCESSFAKSLGYALRSAAARQRGWYRRNVGGYICASQFLKSKLVNAGFRSDRFFVIPNLVADPTSSAPNGIPPLGNYVAYVGRLSPEKGINTFLQAAARCPDIPFRVAGRLREGLSTISMPARNVQLLGFLQGEQLQQFYAGARVVVVPSECYESFGMTVAEGMLWKRPVLVSRIGVFCEFVNDGETGVHFSPGNVDDLALKIRGLWSNRGLCETIGRAGRAYALANYSEESFYSKLMNCFNTVCITNRRAFGDLRPPRSKEALQNAASLPACEDDTQPSNCRVSQR